MKTISAIAACSFLAFCAPSFAQNSTDGPDRFGAAHDAQGGGVKTDNGMSEGRAAATNSPEAEGPRLDREGKPESLGAQSETEKLTK